MHELLDRGDGFERRLDGASRQHFGGRHGLDRDPRAQGDSQAPKRGPLAYGNAFP